MFTNNVRALKYINSHSGIGVYMTYENNDARTVSIIDDMGHESNFWFDNAIDAVGAYNRVFYIIASRNDATFDDAFDAVG